LEIYSHISHEDPILHVAPLLQNRVRHVGNPDGRNSGRAVLVWPPIAKCRPYLSSFMRICLLVRKMKLETHRKADDVKTLVFPL